LTQAPTTTDPGRELFQEIAWRDFILWAHGEPRMVEAWTNATAPAAVRARLAELGPESGNG
jgi:hypothetical protein